MDNLIIIIAGFLIVAGLIGCLIPKLPGVVLSFLGLIVLHFSTIAEFSSHFFIRYGILVIAVQGLDYLIPNWGIRKFGGSKKGVWGSLTGMLIGLFFGPWGIIVGAIVGAFIGELFAGKQSYIAINQAISSFVFFILGTVFQLIVAGLFLQFYIDELSYVFQ